MPEIAISAETLPAEDTTPPGHDLPPNHRPRPTHEGKHREDADALALSPRLVLVHADSELLAALERQIAKHAVFKQLYGVL
jgi:hypothetical protein